MARHLIELGCFLAIFLAPLPLSLAAAQKALPRFRRETLGHSCLAALAVWFLALLLQGHLLGLAGVLCLPGALASSAALFAGGLICWRSQGPPAGAPTAAERLAAIRLQPAAAVLAGLFLLALFHGSLEIVRGHDSYSYHLSESARWLLHGDFRMFSAMEGRSLSYYHFGWDVLFALAILPFQSDFLVVIPNVLAWLYAALLIVGILGRIGVSSPRSWLWAGLFAAAPRIFRQTQMALIDVGLLAHFLAVLYFGMRFFERRRGLDLFLCLASVGVACGAKTSGIAWVIVAALTLAVWASVHRRSMAVESPRGLFPGFASGALAACFLGAFWPVRNLYYTGHLLGRMETPGWDTTIAGSKAIRDAANWPGVAEGLLWGLGLPGAVIALAGLAGLARLVLSPREGVVRRAIPLIVLLVLSVALYAVTPFSATSLQLEFSVPIFSVNLRYAYPVFVALVLLAGLAWDGEQPPRPRWVLVVLLLAGEGVAQGLVRGSFPLREIADWAVYLLPHGIVFLCGAGVFYAAASSRLLAVPLRFRRVMAALAVVFVVVLPLFTWLAERHQARQRAHKHGGIQAFLRNELPPGERLLVLDTDLPYLFYGPGLQVDARSALYPGRWNFTNRPNIESIPSALGYMESEGIRYAAAGPGALAEPEFHAQLDKAIARGELEIVHGRDARVEPIVLRLANMAGQGSPAPPQPLKDSQAP